MQNVPFKLMGGRVEAALWRDTWYTHYDDDHAIRSAAFLYHLIESEGVAEILRGLPSRIGDVSAYVDLRYVLLSLARAELIVPRRLTWWERITGRLQR
jgi:hypothetical protein